MQRRTATLALLVGVCVVAAGCSSGHGSNLPASSLTRSSDHATTTTTTGHGGGGPTSTSSTTTTTSGGSGPTGTTGNTGAAGSTGNTGNTGSYFAAAPCPDPPTAVMTSSQTSQTPVAGNPQLVQFSVVATGTFTNPSLDPVLMDADLVVSSQTTPNGPTETSQVPVSATDPNEAGLLAGPITIDWQQSTTVSEYAGGQPTVSVSPGWTYSLPSLTQCDQ
jgi:hypothetical protein